MPGDAQDDMCAASPDDSAAGEGTMTREEFRDLNGLEPLTDDILTTDLYEMVDQFNTLLQSMMEHDLEVSCDGVIIHRLSHVTVKKILYLRRV